MAHKLEHKPTRRSKDPALLSRLARIDEATRKEIARDERPLALVASAYGLQPFQVSRLRQRYAPLQNGIGRPSTYSEDVAVRIIQHFSEGVDWASAIRAEGIPIATAYIWLDQVPAFSEARARALDAWGAAKAAEIAAIADDPALDAKEKQVRIKSRQWLMERQLEEYQRKTPRRGEGGNTTMNFLTILQKAEQVANDPQSVVLEALSTAQKGKKR